MIQDIFPHRFDNSYKHIAPEENDTVIYFKEGRILGRYEEEKRQFVFPGYEGKKELIYLFSVDEKPCFFDPEGADERPGFEYYSMKDIRGLKLSDKLPVFIAFTAFHLAMWYAGNRFCGACGKPLIYATDERALECPGCHKRIYPRINPAVIIGVKNGDRLLITRYREGYAHNALVAGFTEIGETLEETVSREVMEEAGIRVKNIRYYKSQPWGVAEDILMGFFCEVDGDDTIKMDESELKYAEWVRREDIRLQPSEYSLTNEMMKMFKDGIEK